MSYKIKLVIAAVILIVLVYAFFAFDLPYRAKVDDFATCAAAGFPIAESYPRQCRDSKGNLYAEQITASTSTTDIAFLDLPLENATVTSPVSLSGQARGRFYFEGSFPVDIVDATGSVIGSGSVKAKSDWMTEGFVPFSGKISFRRASTTAGFIRLKNDNPSGDPSRDISIDVPVRFSLINSR